MAAMKPQEIGIDRLCRATIEEKWGDLSKLPKELVDGVFTVYREFMTCYLNILRQQDNKSSDWIPETVRIDSELTDQMSHFFSDYQHITRKFCKLNQKMEQVLAMSKDTHPKLYHHKIDEILARFVLQVTQGDKDEENR
jgi:hypothetical protein